MNDSQQQLWESMKEKTIFMHQDEVIIPNHLQDSLGIFERNRNLDRIDQKLDKIEKKLSSQLKTISLDNYQHIEARLNLSE